MVKEKKKDFLAFYEFYLNALNDSWAALSSLLYRTHSPTHSFAGGIFNRSYLLAEGNQLSEEDASASFSSSSCPINQNNMNDASIANNNNNNISISDHILNNNNNNAHAINYNTMKPGEFEGRNSFIWRAIGACAW